MFLSLFNFSRTNWFLYDVADLRNNGKAWNRERLSTSLLDAMLFFSKNYITVI